MVIRVKLDQEAVGLATVFEKITQARVKDCFREEDTVYFVVGTGELGKAIGKAGSTIKRVQEALGKRIKIIEYHDSIPDFIRSIIYPLTIQEVQVQGDVAMLRDSSTKAKSLLIGRGGRNLHVINRAVQRFFNVEVKVE